MKDLTHLDALSTRDSNRAALARDLRRRITDPPCAKPEVGMAPARGRLRIQSVEAGPRGSAAASLGYLHHLRSCGALRPPGHRVDQHTGLSAGDAYRNGHRLDERGRRLPG